MGCMPPFVLADISPVNGGNPCFPAAPLDSGFRRNDVLSAVEGKGIRRPPLAGIPAGGQV